MPCCHGHPEVVLLAEGWASSEVGLCEGEEGCSDTTGCLERSPSQEECKGVWEGRGGRRGEGVLDGREERRKGVQGGRMVEMEG